MRQLKAMIGSRAHLEAAKGTPQQNREYCSKEDEHPIVLGTMPQSQPDICAKARRVKRNKMLLEMSMKDMVDSGEVSVLSLPLIERSRNIYGRLGEPLITPSVRGIWIYGPPGTGKTHFVAEKETSLFWKPQNKWWDGYQGEEAVLLDDLDSPCLGHHLKRWMDRYACTGEVKGGKVALQHRRFYVTSNKLPKDLWPDDKMMQEAIMRRVDVKHFLIKYTG